VGVALSVFFVALCLAGSVVSATACVSGVVEVVVLFGSFEHAVHVNNNSKLMVSNFNFMEFASSFLE
jgi:hypothetical protein